MVQEAEEALQAEAGVVGHQEEVVEDSVAIAEDHSARQVGVAEVSAQEAHQEVEGEEDSAVEAAVGEAIERESNVTPRSSPWRLIQHCAFLSCPTHRA